MDNRGRAFLKYEGFSFLGRRIRVSSPDGSICARISSEVDMFYQQVTKEFVLRQLDQLPPSRLPEVARFIEFLQFQAQQPVHRKKSRKRTAFGIWADYPEAQDPVAFSELLRRKIETRQDG